MRTDVQAFLSGSHVPYPHSPNASRAPLTVSRQEFAIRRKGRAANQILIALELPAQRSGGNLPEMNDGASFPLLPVARGCQDLAVRREGNVVADMGAIDPAR